MIRDINEAAPLHQVELFDENPLSDPGCGCQLNSSSVHIVLSLNIITNLPMEGILSGK